MNDWNEPSRVTLFVFGMMVSVAGFLLLGPLDGMCTPQFAAARTTPAAPRASIHQPAPVPTPPPPPPVVVYVQPPAPASTSLAPPRTVDSVQPPEPAREACSAAYPDYCIPPPPPDLNCEDIHGRKPFRVLPPDPHHFDRDHDGWGCEPRKGRRRN